MSDVSLLLTFGTLSLFQSLSPDIVTEQARQASSTILPLRFGLLHRKIQNRPLKWINVIIRLLLLLGPD